MAKLNNGANNIAFAGSGVVNSQGFVPQDGIRIALSCTATRAGTVEPFMYDLDVGPGTAESQASAEVVTANIPVVFQIEGAFGGAGVGFFLRYTDTSGLAGTVDFRSGTPEGD